MADVVLPTIVEALSAVMADVQAVGKTGRNTKQNYNFRGIDAVVNAVGPALRTHGVVVVPQAESVEYETYSTSGGTAMKSCVVRVRFVFHGPAGDTLEAVAYGESSDAGDKSTPKAHSVAFRTALLQALCIPTDEPDPDESSHERVIWEPPQVHSSWETAHDRDMAWDDLRAATAMLTDEQAAEVRAAVKALGFTKGTFTTDHAEQWEKLLPAPADLSEFAAEATT